MRVPQRRNYGFNFSAAGLRPDPKKVQALREALRPQNASEMRSVLGMAQYIARFCDNFATITEPLCALTKQDSEWHWTKEEEDVFERV